METRRLRLFLKIAQTGSINRAASAVGMAQPALSQQLAILETELKARLFTRSRSGVTLTEAGRRLHSRALLILRQFELLEHDLDAEPECENVRLSLGIPPTLAGSLGLGLVSQAMEDYPELQIHLSEASGNALIEDLRSGLLDMAILPAAGSLRDVEMRPLMRERLLLATAADAPSPPNDALGMSRLPWVTTQSPNQLRAAISAWFSPHGIEPRIVAELNSLHVVLGLVAKGKGVTLIPQSAVVASPFAKSIQLHAVHPAVHRTLYLALRCERAESASVAAVEQLLRSCVDRIQDCEPVQCLAPES